MCYRCQVCDKVSQPGQSRLTHIVTRDVPAQRTATYVTNTSTRTKLVNGTRTEIAREVQVCSTCKELLNAGLSVKLIRLRYLKARVMKAGQALVVPTAKAVKL
jgi:hypothetical protein